MEEWRRDGLASAYAAGLALFVVLFAISLGLVLGTTWIINI